MRAKFPLYLLLFTILVLTIINLLQFYAARNLQKTIRNKEIYLELLTHSYLETVKLIPLNFNTTSQVTTLQKKDLVLTDLNKYDFILNISELNCMECIKSIKKNVIDKLQKKIAIIGNYSSFTTLQGIVYKLKFNPENVFYTKEPLFENSHLTDFNSPYIFKIDENNKPQLLLIPIKEIENVQSSFINNL